MMKTEQLKLEGTATSDMLATIRLIEMLISSSPTSCQEDLLIGCIVVKNRYKHLVDEHRVIEGSMTDMVIDDTCITIQKLENNKRVLDEIENEKKMKEDSKCNH